MRTEDDAIEEAYFNAFPGLDRKWWYCEDKDHSGIWFDGYGNEVGEGIAYMGNKTELVAYLNAMPKHADVPDVQEVIDFLVDWARRVAAA